MKKIELLIGYTGSGVPVIWSGADNPHIAVAGRSGMGKSYFNKGLLEQAALQVFFRPDDTNLTQLAKNLSQGKSGQVEQYRKVIRSLRVGQFLFRRPDGRILVVSVPPRPEEGGKMQR